MRTRRGEVQKPRDKRRENVTAAAYLTRLRCFRCHVFDSPPPPIRSEQNKDRLINLRVDANVAKSSQTPTKVNGVPRSEKREGEKRRRDGGGEKIWGSNASLMRLLVVSAVGAWHRRGAVSQPTKNLQCLPHFSSPVLSEDPTHTHGEHTATHSRRTHIVHGKSTMLVLTKNRSVVSKKK